MLILHRYLLRQFLQVFVICFCSLDGLYIVIDAFTNLEEFARAGDKHGGVLAMMARYYAPRVLAFFDTTSAVVTLIAAMFTLALFQRHNELTALLAAGIPKWRIIKPVIFAAGVIAALGVIDREVVIPHFRDKLSNDVHDLTGENGRDVHPQLDVTTGILINGKQTISKTRQIHGPTFLLPRDAPFIKIEAADAYYRPAGNDHPSGLLVKGITLPKDLARRPSFPETGNPIIFTPRDHPWLKPGECFVVSEITFDQLAGNDNWRQLSSTFELIRGLRNPSLALGPDVAVSIHSRFLQPFLDMTLLFLGLPLILRRGNPNVFVAIGLCLSVVVAFMVLVLAAKFLGSSYLISPSLGAWLPVMVFVPLAMAMSEPLRE